METIYKIPFPNSSPNSNILQFKELLKSYPKSLFRKDQVVFVKGEAPAFIYYQEEGTTLLVSPSYQEEKGVVIGYIQGGWFLNLTSLTKRQSYTHSAKILSSSILRAIPIVEFQSLLIRNAYLYPLVMTSLARTLEKQQQRYLQTTSLSSDCKIITFLIDQFQERGIRIGYEWVIHDFFNQSEIALLTNTARQTVNSLFNDLRRQNIIHYRYKYFIIRDIAQLEKSLNN